jgi:hypothetical protein
MRNCRYLAALTAASAAMIGGVARAADFVSNDSLSINPPIYSDDQPRKPLMYGLDKLGLASQLDEWGINVGGVVEASWTDNFNHPDNGLNQGHGFDIENYAVNFDQLDLFVERQVTTSSAKFDFGGRMEWIYGSDARFIHANGLFDHYGFHDGPVNQFDPVQAYLQANLPYGNGILVTAGKYVTSIGYETINPTTNNFFSHSFMFFFSSPFTTTGVQAKYVIDKNYSFTLGVVRGWDQALEDNNKSVSYTGQFTYSVDQLDFILNVITGPEEPGINSKYRTLLDGIVVYRPDDKWTFALNADYGWEANPGAGQTGIWWAAAGYATYTLNDMFALQGRCEYFDDRDGVRGIGSQIGEVTLGVNIKPMSNDAYGSGLMIRPEVRFDWANAAEFNGGLDDNQTIFGIDALYAF